jgi:hypothetical protein
MDVLSACDVEELPCWDVKALKGTAGVAYACAEFLKQIT